MKGRNMKLKNIKSRNMESKLKNFNEFILEEEGMGTVEIILIIVVLIGLVIIFKTSSALW